MIKVTRGSGRVVESKLSSHSGRGQVKHRDALGAFFGDDRRVAGDDGPVGFWPNRELVRHEVVDVSQTKMRLRKLSPPTTRPPPAFGTGD